MSVVQKLRKVPLAQHFIHAHGHAVGQVQAAAGVPHGHADAVFLIGGQQGFRQAGVLPPEHQIAAVRVGNVGMTVAALAGEIKEGAAVLCKKVVQIVVRGDAQQMPVVQPRPFEFFVVYRKSHRPHQMQPRSSAGAGAGDVAGILWNLRLKQDDVQPRLMLLQGGSSPQK